MNPDKGGVPVLDPQRYAAALHAAPEQPFTVTEAHRQMQRHRECSADVCPRKHAARDILIRAGRMIPPGRESQVPR
ncbi:hypothetical protein [Nocardia arizonensis]|uniref:hypothetical protein n=1 Tax=Nocardia arizonensis TaxID=1141647 RepID=UPI0006D25F73|nr:hypothetical protein [Nocardia arizonensis]